MLPETIEAHPAVGHLAAFDLFVESDPEFDHAFRIGAVCDSRCVHPRDSLQGSRDLRELHGLYRGSVEIARSENNCRNDQGRDCQFRHSTGHNSSPSCRIVDSFRLMTGQVVQKLFFADGHIHCDLGSQLAEQKVLSTDRVEITPTFQATLQVVVEMPCLLSWERSHHQIGDEVSDLVAFAVHHCDPSVRNSCNWRRAVLSFWHTPECERFRFFAIVWALCPSK